MSDTYPRLTYAERLPSTIPNRWGGGWKHEAAIKTYLELAAPSYGIELKQNLDACNEATVSRADYKVYYAKSERRKPHILETKLDVSQFLTSVGEDGGPLFDGIRTDEMAYKPCDISWPSIIFAGRDEHDRRERLEEEYPGIVIVADDDSPTYCPPFSAFQASLERAFEYHVSR